MYILQLTGPLCGGDTCPVLGWLHHFTVFMEGNVVVTLGRSLDMDYNMSVNLHLQNMKA